MTTQSEGRANRYWRQAIQHPEDYNNKSHGEKLIWNETMETSTNDLDLDDGRLSTSQEKVLSCTAAITGALSICGSSLIMMRVIKNRGSLNPYERIMFALSFCDIIASLNYALSPFLMPAETSTRVWAVGTDGTCNLLGFLQQFSISAILYNGILSFYYFMTVRKGLRRKQFAKKYELYLHAFTFGYAFLTAFLAAIIGMYGEIELGFGCWIKEYPKNCEETDSCISHYLGWVFAAIPFLLVFIALPVFNLMIYLFVRKALEIKGDEEAQQSELKARQIQEVARQGFLYVFSFFLSYSFAFALKAVESYDAWQEKDVFILLLLNATLPPLQGLFNAFIYFRPSYIRVRIAHPDNSRVWALHYILDRTEIPRLTTNFSGTSKQLTHLKSNQSNRSTRQGTNKGVKKVSNFSSDLGCIDEEGESHTESSFHDSNLKTYDPSKGIDSPYNERPKLSVTQEDTLSTRTRTDKSADSYMAGLRINMDGTVDDWIPADSQSPENSRIPSQMQDSSTSRQEEEDENEYPGDSRLT